MQAEVKDNAQNRNAVKNIQGFFSAFEYLTEQADEDITCGNGGICVHHRFAGVYLALYVHSGAGFFGKGNQDAYDIPCRQANEDAQYIFSETGGIGKEHEKITLAHAAVADVFEHAGFKNADA